MTARAAYDHSTERAIRQSSLPPLWRRVLAQLWHLSDNVTHTVPPSMEDEWGKSVRAIAHEVGMDWRHCRRILRELQALGLVDIERRYAPNGAFLTNLYGVRVEALHDYLNHTAERARQLVAELADGASSTARKIAAHVTGGLERLAARATAWAERVTASPPSPPHAADALPRADIPAAPPRSSPSSAEGPASPAGLCASLLEQARAAWRAREQQGLDAPLRRLWSALGCPDPAAWLDQLERVRALPTVDPRWDLKPAAFKGRLAELDVAARTAPPARPSSPISSLFGGGGWSKPGGHTSGTPPGG